MNPTGLAR